MDQTHGCVLFSKIPFVVVLQKQVTETRPKKQRKAWSFSLFFLLRVVPPRCMREFGLNGVVIGG